MAPLGELTDSICCWLTTLQLLSMKHPGFKLIPAAASAFAAIDHTAIDVCVQLFLVDRYVMGTGMCSGNACLFQDFHAGH